MLKKILFAVALFLKFSLYSEANPIKIDSRFVPEISNLSNQDVMFKQFLDCVKYNDKMLAQGDELLFEFYSYSCKKEDSLFSIHAATGIPYDTIATLNRISVIQENLTGKKLILPCVKGIFVCEESENSIEILIVRERDFSKSEYNCFQLDKYLFTFLPDERFTQTERAFFLDSSIKLPVDKKIVSSKFGYRNSPVYGKWKFHKGVDFQVSEGSSVYACKGGKVSFVKLKDPVFGNYLIIRHADGLSSVYAHLSKIAVSTGDMVSAGKLIAFSGNTGMTTGPHLHFEIRKNGEALNPEDYLPKK